MSRKHTKQMTGTEKAFVHGFIRANVARVTGQAHFYNRASERTFTLDEAIQTVRGGLVVEVHDDRKPDVRAVVRSQNGTCVVLSLTTWEVITVYYNDPNDTHDTLNWNAYRWSQDLVSLVKGLRSQVTA
jgi:hypothetical protein